MLVGHIYIIDLRRTHPSYLQALQRFLGAFSPKKNWAIETDPGGIFKVAVRSGSLDAKVKTHFIPKSGALELRVGENKTQLSFPDYPYGLEFDRVTPGDKPREEGQDITAVNENQAEIIQELKDKIDEAHGRK